MTNRKFSAHGDAVMSVDWKESLDERGEGRAAGGWIASGGLDKKVHVSWCLRSSLFVLLANFPSIPGRFGTTPRLARLSIEPSGRLFLSARSPGDQVMTPSSPCPLTPPRHHLVLSWMRSRPSRRSKYGTSVGDTSRSTYSRVEKVQSRVSLTPNLLELRVPSLMLNPFSRLFSPQRSLGTTIALCGPPTRTDLSPNSTFGFTLVHSMTSLAQRYAGLQPGTSHLL